MRGLPGATPTGLALAPDEKRLYVTLADMNAVAVIELAAHSLRGLTAVLDTIDDVWAELNPDLDFAGVLPNRVPPVSNEADRRFDELADMVGRRSIWKPSTPQRSLINQAAGDRQPIHAYGYRARDIADIFDAHYAKVRRLGR